MSKFQIDGFPINECLVLEESKNPLRNGVLGKVKGPMFVPEGVSRNRRFYPRSLWEKQLSRPEVQDMLAERRMLGSVGHDVEITDKTVREGNISHITTLLEVRGKTGYGEAEILDTPSGRNLKALLDAGVKVYSSTRATGDLKGKTDEGIPIVDEDKYNLIGVDFVLDPGFLEANPQMAENAKEILNTKDNSTLNNQEIETVSEKIIEKTLEENSKLRDDLNSAALENANFKSRIAELESENENLKSNIDDFEKVSESLSEYQELGSADDIEDLLKVVERYAQLGKPSEIEEAIETSKEVISSYSELGSPSDIANCLKVLESYQEFGSPEMFEQVIDKSYEVINSYRELGTIEEVNTVLSTYKSILEENVKTKRENEIKELAEKCGVDQSKIERVFDVMTSDEIVELFSGISKPTNLGNGETVVVESNEEPRPSYRKKTIAESIFNK